MAKALGWDGIGLYSHLSFEIDDTRDAAIAKIENEAVVKAWLVFE